VASCGKTGFKTAQNPIEENKPRKNREKLGFKDKHGLWGQRTGGKGGVHMGRVS